MVKVSPEQLVALNEATAQHRLTQLCEIVAESNPEVDELELRRRVQAALISADEYRFDDDEAIGQLASVTASLGVEFLHDEAVQELLSLEMDCTARMDLLLQAIETA